MYVLDCDGVILDWCEGFKSYCESKHGAAVQFKSIYPTTHHLSDWVRLSGGGDIHGRINNLVREFNSSPEFMFLAPVKDSSDFLKYCYDHDIRYKILTSCGDSYRTAVHRLINLQLCTRESAIGHDNLICLGLGESKTPVLKALIHMGYSVFVDDHPAHVNEAWEAGYKAYLFDTEANKKNAGNRIHSLMELIK